MILKILKWFSYVRELEAKIVELEGVLKAWRDHAISLAEQAEKKV